MAEQAQGTNRIAALHEPLRRLDAVLNFARKLVNDTGALPDGLLEDFIETRRAVEKEFVRTFDLLDLDTLQAFRNFLQATRDIDQRKIEKNLHRLSRRARGLLHRILIAESKGPGHGSEVGAVRFNDHDPPLPASSGDGSKGASTSPKRGNTWKLARRAVVALLLLAVLAGIGLGAAWAVGAFDPQRTPDNTSPVAQTPPDNQPVQTPVKVPDPPKDYDPTEQGYAVAPAVQVPANGIDLLAAEEGELRLHNLPGLLLGLEQLVGEIEPPRLKTPPAQTADLWKTFAEGVVLREPNWRESRKPMLEAFTGHLRTELHFARYPQERSADTVLPSDVLYAAGGPQFPLIITSQVLAQSCSLPMIPLAPNGAARVELAMRLPARIDTWNGEALGLRTGNHTVLNAREILAELAALLRPTMRTAQGRCAADVLTLRYGEQFTVEHARAALADLDPRWLQRPADDAAPAVRVAFRIALQLQPVVCKVLTADSVAGDVDEAIKLYRLANAAQDTAHVNRAILLMGRRAGKAQMLDGEPLALVVGDLLARQGNHNEAQAWFRRAHEEHPDDPRAALRLALRAEGGARFALLREAYARGERAPSFMRQLAREASQQGEGLLALGVLDELCSGAQFDAIDLENAVLQCIALERVDWAQQRLAKHAELVAGEPRLQRVDLICELSANGMSERAQTLARAWRQRGEQDPFVESLLQRFGG